MSSALLRRLAPLSLFAVPLLIPALVTASNATTTKTAAKTTTTTTTTKATTSTAITIPSAARGVRFGTSLGGNTSATLKLFPSPRVIRVFDRSPSAKLPSLPSSAAIYYSFKTSPSVVASGKFNATFATILKAWNQSGRTVYWTWYHEADRDGISSAQFRQGWAQLLSVEKKYPSTHVKSMSILTGILLAPNHPHGNPENWYVNADVLGFDCYVPASVPRAMAYAKAKHKSWALPEFGADNGDAGDVAYIKSTIASWVGYPPIGASWYNHTAGASFSQPLWHLPQTVSFLKALASAY